MRHAIVIACGAAWAAITLLLCRLWDMPAADMLAVAPQFLAAGIATSYVVTSLYRRQLAAPDVKRKFWLPLLTILTAVPIWSTILYSGSAVVSTIRGRHDLFDGFWFFVLAGLVTAFTVGLPLTYPAAYLTQVLVSRYARPKLT
jgi:NO-binding membrane sensor protein with MHYT domain